MYRSVLFFLGPLICLTAGKDWWEAGNFYQIYPRSFQDSDGDGIGDLNGITLKLDHLKDIGITGVWLSPIFESPMIDFGYDTSDYTKVHHEYGTLDDFTILARKCNELGIRLILDFVPNHTSDQHEWFQKSVAGDELYKDFYIWHPGHYNAETNITSPPNNWVSVFRFSAWTWNEQRKEFYLHQFAKQQPDLNYRNPKVVNAMKSVLQLWLDRGVTGFRIDAVPYLFEVAADNDGNYPNEPVSGICDDPDSTCYLKHIYTQDMDETFDMAYQWRDVLVRYQSLHGGETRIIMIEAYTTLQNSIRFYGNDTVKGAQIPFNFELINYIRNDSKAVDYKKHIDSWLNLMPKGQQANWVMGNHDNKRLGTRFGVARIDVLNILLQTLPGIAVTYYGEEIGMTDVFISWADTVDPQGCNTNSSVYLDWSRDPARTPFQWDNSKNAGFSWGPKTWLPVAIDYQTNNVKEQKKSAFSHLKIFKTLTKIRRTATFQEGDYNSVVLSENILSYTRTLEGSDTYVILLNFGSGNETVNLKSVFDVLGANLEVITASLQSNYVAGEIVSSQEVRVDANVGLVLVCI